jgi:hypothetical protein
MIGEKGKVAFIHDDTTTRFYAGHEQKYMWHLWGDEDELSGQFKVVGVNKETKEEVEVLKANIYGVSPNNNANADERIPSLMSLPYPGLWRLDAYIDEKLFGSIVVKVYPEEERPK